MSTLLVQPAGQAWEERAWDLLLQHLPLQARQQQIAALKSVSGHSGFSPQHLWVALRDDVLTGVLVQLPQPDKVAFVWPPVILPTEVGDSAEDVCDALLVASGRQADASGIQFSQVMLAEGETSPPACLGRNGYTFNATLLLLDRDLDVNLPGPATAELASEPFREGESGRLAELLHRTYQGSQDCPAITGWRTGTDALARHLAVGEPALRHWTFFQSAGKDVAVLLLLENRAETSCEIDYFGVVPEARGRGFGRQVISWGLRRAIERGTCRMHAIVDANNHYACKTYADCGFRIAGERRILIRSHPDFVETGLNKFSTIKNGPNRRS